MNYRDEYSYKVIGWYVATEGDAQFSSDYDIDQDCDTLKEAKERARHWLTKEYQDVCEASRLITYVQIIDIRGDCGDIVWDTGSLVSEDKENV